MKRSISFKKVFIALLFIVSLTLTCVGLSACSGDYAKEIIEAQNKTEKLKDFGINLSGSVEFSLGYTSVTKRVEEQYICYGSGNDRRIYTDKVDQADRNSVYYYVGNLRYKYYDSHCDSCKRVKDSEIYKKPFESEKISDFDGAKVSRSTNDGNYVYSATLTKEIILKQLKEMEADLPKDVEFNLKDEYKCTYTVDKKSGYLIEYYIPECQVGYRSADEAGWHFLTLGYKLSIVTDRNELKIEYPDTFEKYEKYYTANGCFRDVELLENGQALENVLANKSKYEKQYNFDEMSMCACDSKSGAVAVGYYCDISTRIESCVDVYDKDMKKISTYSFYGMVNGLSMENGRLAVAILKQTIGSRREKGYVYVFDLAENSLIYSTAAPDSGLGLSVVLYGDALAYYAEYADFRLFVYNFSSGKTVVPEINNSIVVWNVEKTPDGGLAVLKREVVDNKSVHSIFEIDDKGTVLGNRTLPEYVSRYNGQYWCGDNYYANIEEELTSLGVENFSGADVPENAEVVFYDGEYALVQGADNTLLVCDLKKEEVIYSSTELDNNAWYFKAGECCWYYQEFDSIDSIYKLDISALVAKD